MKLTTLYFHSQDQNIVVVTQNNNKTIDIHNFYNSFSIVYNYNIEQLRAYSLNIPPFEFFSLYLISFT